MHQQEKIELIASDIQKEIDALKVYRSGWENQIREGWNFGTGEAHEILHELYEISVCQNCPTSAPWSKK